MSGWEAGLEALRVEFLRESRARLQRGAELLERLAAEPAGDSAVDDLARVFHAFAGSAATFGFPEVSDLGLEGERLCDRSRRGAPQARADDLQACRVLLARIQQHLESSGAPGAPPAATVAVEEKTPSADVLVVEDDPAFADLLEAKLASEGFGVRRAASLAQAEQALRSGRPDAVVADVLLPDGTVYPFVERLRGVPGGEAVPVLAVTALRALPDRVEAVRCGVDAFFMKPAELDEIVARLRFLLQREKGEPARVLSVDDDRQQAEFLRMVLESAGYAFRWCSDPAAAEAEVAAFRPQLVLMDVVLPGISGFELVHVLRLDRRNAVLPIVFLTTRHRIEDRIRATSAGGDEYLEKPVTPGLLLTTVAARIERARLFDSLVSHDALTGLLNHGALLARIPAVIASSLRRRAPVALAMLDVDHFKAVNDRYGHVVGDGVLASLGSLLRRRLRQSDVVGRYGGEEFVAVVENLELHDALRLTQRLLDEFARVEHVAPDGSLFRVTLSAGVALLEQGMSPSDWCARADRRLYAAKAAGRARVVAAD